MVRWPRAADRHFTVFQLLGGGGVPILVFFHRLGIDQMGDAGEQQQPEDVSNRNQEVSGQLFPSCHAERLPGERQP